MIAQILLQTNIVTLFPLPNRTMDPPRNESILDSGYPTWIPLRTLENLFQAGDILSLEPDGSLTSHFNVFEKGDQWFESQSWPSLGLSKADLIASSLSENILSSLGCWWGVTTRDNSPSQLEITFQSMEKEGYIFLTSLPTVHVHCPSAVLPKLINWWRLAKRSAIEQFWGGHVEASRSLFLVLSTLTTRRVASTTFTSIGAEATIQLSGSVGEETGSIYFQHEPPWRLGSVNELNLGIQDSDSPKACMLKVIGSRMFRVTPLLRPLAEKIWR